MLAESDLFEPGRAVLTATGRQRLDTIAAGFKRLKRPPSASFVIAAFTDRGPGGDEDLGRILTQEQAEAVKTYLTARHKIQSNGWFTSARKVAAVGFGSRAPHVPTAASQPARRVEIIVFTPQV